jgi:predicted RNA binding protein YcfA (HicA-like mRNA interferase family)
LLVFTRTHDEGPAQRVTGSHRTFRYKHPETDEVRTVTVPLHDELNGGTLREIADEAGAGDFDAFCDEIENWL